MNRYFKLKLCLYLSANTLPLIVDWLTNTWDFTPRGLLILFSKTLLTIVVTTRAYLDHTVSDGKEDEIDVNVVNKQSNPVPTTTEPEPKP